MSIKRQSPDHGVLVRFWSLDHHRSEQILWPVSPWSKLVYAAEGTLQVESSDQLWIVPPNRALWVEAGEEHRAVTVGRARVRTLYFAPTLKLARPRGPMEVSPLLKELIVEACLAGPLMAGERRPEALATLLQWEIGHAPLAPSGLRMPSSRWLCDWASQFLAYPLQAPDCAWSRRTLERQMLKETGLTLGQWCQQARALVGLRALSTGSTVAEAAIEAGYATPSGFIHAFRRRFGTTPGAMASSP